jgi:hypothetical protein
MLERVAAGAQQDRLDALVAEDLKCGGEQMAQLIYRCGRRVVGRRQFARVLRKLPDAAFERIATHDKNGRRTLGDMVQSYVNHLDSHMKFVVTKRETLGKALR